MENILYTGKKLTARTRMEPASSMDTGQRNTQDTFDILEVA